MYVDEAICTCAGGRFAWVPLRDEGVRRVTQALWRCTTGPKPKLWTAAWTSWAPTTGSLPSTKLCGSFHFRRTLGTLSFRSWRCCPSFTSGGVWRKCRPCPGKCFRFGRRANPPRCRLGSRRHDGQRTHPPTVELSTNSLPRSGSSPSDVPCTAAPAARPLAFLPGSRSLPMTAASFPLICWCPLGPRMGPIPRPVPM